jgi:hypothetical protein
LCRLARVRSGYPCVSNLSNRNLTTRWSTDAPIRSAHVSSLRDGALLILVVIRTDIAD